MLRFFPESAYIELTGMSEHALVYDKRDFAHRTLVLFEAGPYGSSGRKPRAT